MAEFQSIDRTGDSVIKWKTVDISDVQNIGSLTNLANGVNKLTVGTYLDITPAILSSNVTLSCDGTNDTLAVYSTDRSLPKFRITETGSLWLDATAEFQCGNLGISEYQINATNGMYISMDEDVPATSKYIFKLGGMTPIYNNSNNGEYIVVSASPGSLADLLYYELNHVQKLKIDYTGLVDCTALKIGSTNGYLTATSGTVSGSATIPTSDIASLSSYASFSNYSTTSAANALYSALAHTHQISNNNIKLGDTSLVGLTSGTDNISIGNNALNALTSGSRNIAIGSLVLDTSTTGNDNVCIGYNSMTADTTGSNNIAIGSYCLDTLTTGTNNIGIGSSSQTAITTGTDNISLGLDSLKTNTTGSKCVAIGSRALSSATTSSWNIAIGEEALYTNTTGGGNCALGYQALFYNTTGYSNVAMGYQSMKQLTTSAQNTAIGHSSLMNVSSGYFNSAIGFESLKANTSGGFNIGVGYKAGVFGTTGSSNIYIGIDSYAQGTAGESNKTFIGNSVTTETNLAGQLKLSKGITILEGSNLYSGNATLVAGTVTISTTAVTATSRIYVSSQNLSGTEYGFVRVSARTASTSFVITSYRGGNTTDTATGDTSDVSWCIITPG